jgi:hypothetical protein
MTGEKFRNSFNDLGVNMNDKEVEEFLVNNPDIVKEAEEFSKKKGFYISRESSLVSGDEVENDADSHVILKDFLDEF